MSDLILAFCRDANAEAVATVLNLPVQQARLLQLIVRSNPMATMAEIQTLVGEPYTSIFRLRATLKALNIQLSNRRGAGYSLTRESKLHLAEVFSEFVNQQVA